MNSGRPKSGAVFHQRMTKSRFSIRAGEAALRFRADEHAHDRRWLGVLLSG